MKDIYEDILNAIEVNEKLLAVLLDPDKLLVEDLERLFKKVNTAKVTHIFVGGSIVEDDKTEEIIAEIKQYTNLPVIIFPGNVNQITKKADAILFLSLISGRNPEYLIGQHIKASAQLSNTSLEVISTAYMLIESGKETTVERVTKTKPLRRNAVKTIINTAKAGELLGMKLIYLEAGSGALHPVPPKIISEVKHAVNIPIIVGGGIKNKIQINNAYNAGADIVVIGTAFEENPTFFNQLNKKDI